MDKKIIGKWVEVELIDGKRWIGKLEEWDDEAVFISNGFEFGHKDHKGAECTSDEVATILETNDRDFSIK